MAGYEIRIKRSAAKEIDGIDSKADRRRIVDRIQALARNPRPAGSEKLSGSERYRIRQGRYRILYTISDDVLVVVVVKVAHRNRVYRTRT